MICPICGIDVPIVDQLEAIGLKASDMHPSHRGTGVDHAMTQKFIKRHTTTRWDPKLKIECPMSGAKVWPL